MKRIGLILLVIVAVLAMTACKKTGGFETATPTAEGSVTVTPLPDLESMYHVCGGEVVLGSYDKLTKKAEPEKVSDAEVEEAFKEDMANALANYPNYIRDESRDGTIVASGDTVNIDYVGKLDGVAFDGGTGQGYDLTVGSESFIADFENGMIGKTVGTTVDIEATFPEDYKSEDLAGKTVVFTVTLNYIGMEKDEADDEYLNRISGGTYKTLDEYREALRSSLQEEKDANFEDDNYQSVIDQMIKNSEFKTISDDDVEFFANDMISYYKEMVAYYGMAIEDYAAQVYGSYDEFLKTIDEEATRYVKEYMVLQEVAKQENITITEEKYNEYINKYMTNSGYSNAADFETAYTREYLEYCMKNDLALELLLAKAKAE